MKKSFEEWMDAVDAHFAKHPFLLDHNDLPDCPYWDMWNMGKSPKFAFNYAMKEARYS